MSILLGQTGAGSKAGLSVLQADADRVINTCQCHQEPESTVAVWCSSWIWLCPSLLFPLSPLQQFLVPPSRPGALLECSWVNFHHRLSRQAYISSLTSIYWKELAYLHLRPGTISTQLLVFIPSFPFSASVAGCSGGAPCGGRLHKQFWC